MSRLSSGEFYALILPSSFHPGPLTEESNGAGQSVLTNQQIGQNRHVGAFEVHRQPECNESRARHLHADHLTAFHWLLIIAITQREEFGRIVTVIHISVDAVPDEGRVE